VAVLGGLHAEAIGMGAEHPAQRRSASLARRALLRVPGPVALARAPRTDPASVTSRATVVGRAPPRALAQRRRRRSSTQRRGAAASMTAPRGARLARTSAVVLVVMALLAACTGSGDPPSGEQGATSSSSSSTSTSTTEPPSSQEPIDGGVLRVASGPLPTDWSPAAGIWDASALQVARGLYDTLAVYDADNVPRPELASAIEPLGDPDAPPDHLQWKITLRPGITMHDGTPLDAGVVQSNLLAQRDSVVGADVLAPVVAVVVVDPVTVVVRMSSPWSTFPEVLTTQIGAIASPATLDGRGGGPVGTGPFRAPADPAAVQPPVSPGEVVLERNPTYWRTGLPHLDAVRVTVHDDPQAAALAVVDGSADLVLASRPRQVSRLERAAEDGTVRVLEDRNAEVPKVAIALDTGRAPFDQIAARRAVGLATDRKDLLDFALDDQGSMARGIISDPSPWFTDLPEPVPDTNRAREQVDSYTDEFGQPLAFELLVPPDPLLQYVATRWRTQLAEVGITVVLVPVGEADLVAAVREGRFQAAMVMGFDSAHPDLYEPLFRGVPGQSPDESANITRWVDLAVTEAYAEARATADLAQQVEQFRLVQEALFTEVPWLFLLQVRRVLGVSPALRGFDAVETASGKPALAIDAATLNRAQFWFDPAALPGAAAEAPTTTVPATSTTGG
jgi:peptide/nickel transport system substrate-binding protein